MGVVKSGVVIEQDTPRVNMYAIYRDLHPPTGIEHCLNCHFFNLEREQLLVASASLLRVYEVHSQFDTSTKQGKPKLILCAEYSFYGNIQSLEKVKLHHSTRDSLIVSFYDAKLSIIEYDPETNGLKTLSMHQFEDDDLRGGLLYNDCRPIVRVDPESRCAAMLFFGSHIAVCPFQQKSIMDTPSTPISIHGDTQDVLSSYTISLRSLPEPVVNVRDLTFIEGYTSPTLLLLCEPCPTWAGRISLRQDTMLVVGLSLNTADKVHPVIWSVRHLPFDALYFLPVPKPLGGVLLFGANSLIYLNQSSPFYGVSLNSISDSSTRFALKKEELSVTFDCSKAVFISSEQVLVSLRTVLYPDNGMRGIKTISFEKVASSILSSCICILQPNYLFLGSRLANSLLLTYSTIVKQGSSSTDANAKLDLDDIEVYGESASSQLMIPSVITSCSFEVCDSILCIGPIANATVGEPAFLSEEFIEKSDPDLELVLCSGHGKNGALSVLQRIVRPQVVTTFELPKCSDMWTVISHDSEGQHAYLLLSRSDSTMVLQTGQEITELDQSGFATQSSTVYAGNIDTYIIQATHTDVRLLKGTKQLCYVALDMGGGVKSVDICSPFVFVLLNDGKIGLLKLVNETLELLWPSIVKGSPVTHISAYVDTSGLFVVANELVKSAPVLAPAAKKPHLSIDDEDELLYGSIVKEPAASIEPLISVTELQPKPPPVSTNWCIICREDGAMEIYSVPEFHLVFAARNFTSAPWTLCDSGRVPSESNTGGAQSNAGVEQILCMGIGPKGKYSYLFALINKELIIYKGFSYPSTLHSGHLQLRFSKVEHKIILYDKKESKLAKHFQQQDVVFPSHLRRFTNIAGYSGVFVSGSYPHWIFMTLKGHLCIHPMYIDGPVRCFAPFDNINCPAGFLYFNKESELRISVLPTHLSYDSYWPTRKVSLKATPHFVSYHMETKTHVVIASVPKPVTSVPVFNSETEEQFENIERDDRFVYSQEETFFLQLLAPTSWELVPNSKFDMDTYYHVTAMKVMRLRSQETLSGRKEFIVVGATAVVGEEVNAKGKLMIFDVTEVIPEPGKPLSQYRLKNLYNQEQKWPVTGLECVNGLILTCMGQKIFMWQFKDKKDLFAVAFIDSETYIHSASSIKGFILTGDVSRSVQLLHYNETRRSLSLISQDPNPMEVYATGYLVDGNGLGLLATDSDKNFVLFQYQPENPVSNGGSYLVRTGDINIGSLVNVFINIRCKTSASLGASTEMKIALADKRHCTFFGTLDGGIGCLLPIAEKVYRRLSMLQIKMTQGLKHLAGLNPKAFRTYQTRHQYLYSIQRNILDGQLLYHYLSLTAKEKIDFAKQIGTTPTQIMEDLKEIDKVTAHF